MGSCFAARLVAAIREVAEGGPDIGIDPGSARAHLLASVSVGDIAVRFRGAAVLAYVVAAFAGIEEVRSLQNVDEEGYQGLQAADAA